VVRTGLSPAPVFLAGLDAAALACRKTSTTSSGFGLRASGILSLKKTDLVT